MFWFDHPHPHFHAYYSGKVGEFSVRSPRLLKGRGFSKRAARLVVEWAKLHQNELLAEWEWLSQGNKAMPIKGLE
jgi:hypothetical protein